MFLFGGAIETFGGAPAHACNASKMYILACI